MFFDGKNFGLVDVAIAMEIAEKVDDGQPKQKLVDSVRRGLARIWQRGAETTAQSGEPACVEGTFEPVQS